MSQQLHVSSAVRQAILTSAIGAMAITATAPAQATTVAALRRTLDAWIHSTGDRGALPDPATEPPQAEILKSKRADYQRTWQARLKTPEPTDAARLAWWEKAYGLTP